MPYSCTKYLSFRVACPFRASHSAVSSVHAAEAFDCRQLPDRRSRCWWSITTARMPRRWPTVCGASASPAPLRGGGKRSHLAARVEHVRNRDHRSEDAGYRRAGSAGQVQGVAAGCGGRARHGARHDRVGRRGDAARGVQLSVEAARFEAAAGGGRERGPQPVFAAGERRAASAGWTSGSASRASSATARRCTTS